MLGGDLDGRGRGGRGRRRRSPAAIARRHRRQPHVRPAGRHVVDPRAIVGRALARRGRRHLRPAHGDPRRRPLAAAPSWSPFAVGGYIAAAYWFTSSTSFANPAVTVARMFSDTFAGIAPSSVPGVRRRPARRRRPGRSRSTATSIRRGRRRRHPTRPTSACPPCCSSASTTPAARRWRSAGSEHLAGDRAVAWSGRQRARRRSTRRRSPPWPRSASTSPREFPKPWTDEIVRAADVVVTMGCGDACPFHPGKRYEDWELDDPAGRDSPRCGPSATRSSDGSATSSNGSAWRPTIPRPVTSPGGADRAGHRGRGGTADAGVGAVPHDARQLRHERVDRDGREGRRHDRDRHPDRDHALHARDGVADDHRRQDRPDDRPQARVRDRVRDLRVRLAHHRARTQPRRCCSSAGRSSRASAPRSSCRPSWRWSPRTSTARNAPAPTASSPSAGAIAVAAGPLIGGLFTTYCVLALRVRRRGPDGRW